MILFHNDNSVVNNKKNSSEECRIVRRLIFLVIIIHFLLVLLPGQSYCYAADPNFELDWDYFIPYSKDRKLDTVSLHVLEKISEKEDRSVYRGITVTRAYGNISLKNTNYQQDSSAVGIGPIYMSRNEKYHSGKLSAAIDMSGGFIVYDKVFPAGGRPFNFMWRIGPQFIYKFNKNSSMNIGYMVMHVSDGFRTRNPSYNAHGISLGFVTKF